MRINPRKKTVAKKDSSPPSRPKSLKRKRADPEKTARKPKSPDLLDIGDAVPLRKLRRLRDEFAGVKESLDELKDREKDLKDQIALLCADSDLPNGFRDGEAAGISIFQGSQTRISRSLLLI